jgi:hypothetical protein
MFNEWICDRIINRNNYPSYHFVEQYLYIEENININILRYENLYQDFSSLMKKYNMNVELDRYDNNTFKIFGIHDFDKKTIELINTVYYNDFIKFNYSLIN